ncbi:MAG TPA: GNAT family N-acetyltransferase [Caulobacteraceae bacterium]|nr:GNAT family N-acetyltransferase [Caulobacteraceae bacterium]
MNDVIEQTPRIETRRLVLRAPEARDAERITVLAGDLGVARMTTSMPHPFHRHHADAFLSRVQALDPAREAVFAIEFEDEGLIGVIGFHPTPIAGGAGRSAPEVGYWLGRLYWGRGLATEAAAGALTWAKTAWRRRMVVSGHFADNPASGRVLEKAGFLYTGEIQPRHCQARGGRADTRMMVWLA